MNDVAVHTLEDLADVQTGPFGSQLHSSDYVDEGTPIITVEHLADNSRISHDCIPRVSVSDRVRLARYSLRLGDLVFSRVGAIDRCSYVSPKEDGWLFSGRLLRVRPNSLRVNSRFLTALLSHESSRRWIKNHAVGSTMPCLNTSILKHLPIRLPQLSEQSGVAEILDTANEAIGSTERLIAKFEQVKEGLLHDLLTRGIDESGHLRDRDRLRSTPLGLVPEGWAVGPLSRVLTSIDAGRSPDLPDSPAQAGEWGVLKVSAVRPNGLQETENKVVTAPSLIDPSIEIEHGDLLISRANTPALVGLVCYVRDPRSGLMLSDKTLRLNIDSKIAVTEFIGYLLQAPSSRRQIETSGTGSSGSMKNISQNEIRSLVLPLPGIEEQYRILARVASTTTRLGVLRRELSKFRLLSGGLMDDLLAGRVRVGASE